MSSLAIRTIDTATPAVQAVADRFRDRRAMHDIVATAMQTVVRRGFKAKAQTEHNPFGKPSTFWLRMLDGTSQSATAEEAVVSVPYEAGLRSTGGTIRPTGGRKALTIPLAAESYGRSARSFTDLVFVPKHGQDEFGEGGEAIGLLIRHTGPDSYQVLYRLVAKVVIRPDAAVLPTDEAFAAEILSDLAFAASRLTE